MIILDHSLLNKGDSRSATWHNLYMENPRISAIAVISAKNRALGLNNKLLWHLPDDLKRFKSLTAGHPIIMGRKTFDSIKAYLGGPLPNRINIVISRSTTQVHPDVLMATNIEDALKLAKQGDPEEIFIGGGTAIYGLALPYTDRLYLTLVEDKTEADSYFPEYEHIFTELVSNEQRTREDGLVYSFTTLDK